MQIEETRLDYDHQGVTLEAFIARDLDAKQPQPVVLVAHMWGGRVDFVDRKAAQLAELGYVGFALDLYGKGVTGSNPAECQSLMQPFMNDRGLLQDRLSRALDTALALPQVRADRVAAIGYCFGGLCVLDLARTRGDLRGVVSLHGLLAAPENLPPGFKAPVLVLHGHIDPMVKPSEISAVQAELESSGVDWQFVRFGGAAHAFTNPAAADPEAGTVFHPRSDRRSWAYTLRFLGEVLS